MLKLRHRIPGLAPRRQRGVVLVIVAVVALAVALSAAGLLAYSLAQFRTADESSQEVQTTVATEGVLNIAAWQIKENLRRIPGNLVAPSSTDGSGGVVAGTVRDLNAIGVQKVLTDGTQPWVGTLSFPTTRGSGQIFVGQETLGTTPTVDELNILDTILGPSDLNRVDFLSDDLYVQRSLDYTYHPGESETEVTIYGHGSLTKGQQDIRTSTQRLTYNQEVDFYGSKERSRDDFNVVTPVSPGVESPHDLTGVGTPTAYPLNMQRAWDVTYAQDPANSGRKIKRIGLVFQANSIGLEDGNDFLTVSNWMNGSFQAPFWLQGGPYLSPSLVVEDPTTDTTTLRITMASDGTQVGVDGDPLLSGFKVAGVKYYFDEETRGAFYETAHPYDAVENSMLAPGALNQTLWSPFQQTEEEAGGTVVVGGGTGGGPVIDPNNPPVRPGRGDNVIQAMRLEFSGDFSLEPGDSLDVVNANSGQLMATYTGNSGALAVTPFASRIFPATPLGIQLRLNLDNTVVSTGEYGYLVSAMEFVDSDGTLRRLDLPRQETAHGENLGSLNDAPMTWNTTVYRPKPPGGAALTSWSIHLNRATNLDAVSAADDDKIRITLRTSGLGIPPTNYVAPGGATAVNPPLFIFDVADLANKTITLPLNCYAVDIAPFLDDEGSYSPAIQNFGYFVDTVAYTADNANAFDFSARAIASTQYFDRTADYPDYGPGTNEVGEWWVTIPGKSEIGLHFDRDNFRIGPGDTLEIWDGAGQLVASLTDDSTDGPPIIVDPDGGGGTVGDLIADPNMPEQYWQQFGWILVKSDTARIVLRGDGGPNNGYNGFILDKVAYFADTFLTNSERPMESADPELYNERVTGPSTGYGEVERQ